MKVTLAIPIALAALSCGSVLSKETQEQGTAVAALWNEINADGVVTDEESARYVDALNLWYGNVREELGGVNWEEVAYSIGGAASVAFLGVNIFRNKMQGKGFITPKPAA